MNSEQPALEHLAQDLERALAAAPGAAALRSSLPPRLLVRARLDGLFCMPRRGKTWRVRLLELPCTYLAPATLAGVLAAWRLLAEHRSQPSQDRRVDTIVAMTNDSFLGGPLKWLLAPRNIGLHIVHHLHPQVCSTALPALREWYRGNLPGYPAAGLGSRP